MRIINGSVFDGEGFVERDVHADGGLFVGEAACTEGDVVDASGCYVIPGLVDLHFHGSAGADISDGDLAGLHKMGAYEASRGITALCPATMTLPEDVLMRAAQAASAYEPAADEAALVGINMEGPFISPSKVGAQNPDYVRNPSAEELRRLQEAAGGLFKLVDIAPEEPGAIPFVDAVKDEVSVSLAHTNSDYEHAMEAFSHGANHAVHLYNAMPPFTHRAPGVVGAVADNPHVMAEMICDGVHIHPSVVRATFAMLGKERMILISDSMRAAGMPNGRYTLGGLDVDVKGNRATLVSDGALAGSVTTLPDCMRTVVQKMGLPLETAVAAATENPARSLGIYDQQGSLTAGKKANVVLLDEDLKLVAVVKDGVQIA